ncbi:MAG TPA: methyltransferase domain-containing protein [Bryobacteraceae bacterium]|jgi:tRNA (mo5U34)-methyltransferase
MKAWNSAYSRKVESEIARLQTLGWYHSIELPGGRVIPGIQTLDQLRTRLSQFPVPQDLRGKRVLDIGAWDGWFSFELEKRGASVVAADAVQSERFLEARDLLGSKVEFVLSDVYDLNPAELGHFDVILFLGVLYHLKHPLLALEKVCALATDLVCVESYVTDDGKKTNRKPSMEFYETTELGGQFDNWVGPNAACLLSFCRAAGFARSSLESVLHNRAHVTCFRKWERPAGHEQAPQIVSVENSVSHNQVFAANRDEYVSLWFKSSHRKLGDSDVFPEIGGYGARPAVVANTGGDGWHAIVKLPPGLSAGWHEVKLRTRNSSYSNIVRIGVGVPEAEWRSQGFPIGESTVKIESLVDGKTWEPNRVQIRPGASISLWVRGLPSACAARDVIVRLDGNDMPSVFVSESDSKGLRQVNAVLPAGLRAGKTSVTIAVETKVAEPVDVEIIPPR